jgi:excisionase family DNA binding protein
MAQDVMTKAQAAQYLHISIATLECWMRGGLVPVVTLPGRRRVLIRKEAVDQVLRDHEQVRSPAAPPPDRLARVLKEAKP